MKKKNPAAVALGKLGGKATLKAIGTEGLQERGRLGGLARLANTTPEQRRAIALKASKAAAAARKQRKKQKETKGK
jgi:hypothetical protein